MFQELYMRRIAATIGVMIIVALASYTYFTLKSAQYIYSGPTTISVQGVGEVFATPDIAQFSFTVEAKEEDAVTAQNKSSETMSSILAYLTEMGIEERDIKTEYYQLSPQYEYPDVVCTQWSCPPRGEPRLIGYQVNQSVSVKVREVDKAGELVSGVGGRGAQNVSGVSFTIDDEDILRDEARVLAIHNAKAKAETLAQNLGVRIVRMNGFWEEHGGGYPYYGKGGDMMEYAMPAMEMRSAELPTGENMITASVNISYEIR